jgi:hypothetical protein
MTDLPGWLQAILIGGGFAAVVGFFVARKSAARKPVQGGPLAHVFHYLGAVATVAPAPIILVGAFAFRLSFGESAALCLGTLSMAFILLIGFAALEVRGRQQRREA